MTDLKQFIHTLTETWKNHQYDDLYDYFHEKVVMLPPGSSQPIVGIELMIESYRQFGSMGTIHGFHITGLTLYDYGLVTMGHMRFEMDYEIEAGRFQEEGLEIYTIDTSGPNPKIVWRTQAALSEGE